MVQEDPSFGGVRWDSTVTVEMISLDELIDEFGVPRFCKIDVEGYELHALRGLSTDISTLSFEYLPAAAEITESCIQIIENLGRYEYNWAVAEKFQLQMPRWINAQEITALLKGALRQGKSGDIYARRKD
jgi:hypothetical protein